MSVAASPATLSAVVDERVATTVSEGLSGQPKRLPAWLFYDAAGSRLFDAITELPEYYLTRTERSILAARAASDRLLCLGRCAGACHRAWRGLGRQDAPAAQSRRRPSEERRI